MAAKAAKNQHADRGKDHQHQQEPEVGHQLPNQGVVFFVQRQIRPVLRLTLYVLQHDELRQRQQRNGGEHRNADALHAHFPPALDGVAQKQHIREIT